MRRGLRNVLRFRRACQLAPGLRFVCSTHSGDSREVNANESTDSVRSQQQQARYRLCNRAWWQIISCDMPSMALGWEHSVGNQRATSYRKPRDRTLEHKLFILPGFFFFFNIVVGKKVFMKFHWNQGWNFIKFSYLLGHTPSLQIQLTYIHSLSVKKK